MRRKILSGLYLFAGLTLLSACAEKYYSEDDFAKMEKIDAHVHINAPAKDFVKLAEEDNFRLLTINVDYPDFPPIDEQYAIALDAKAKYPDRVAFASTFSMNGWDDPDWKEKVIQRLDESFTAGAVAVKVWKNIGMDFHDKNYRVFV